MNEKRTLFETKAAEWTGHVVRIYVVNGFQVRGELIASDAWSVLIKDDKQKQEMLINRENITTMESLYKK